MKLNVNCERCGDYLRKGNVYNYKDKTLCDDCYILHYLFDQIKPGSYSPNKMVLPDRTSEAAGKTGGQVHCFKQ